MKTNLRTVVTLVALFATLTVSLGQFAPIAHANQGGNQFWISVSFSESNVVVTTNAYFKDRSVKSVAFCITVSFSGTDRLNKNKQGIPIDSECAVVSAFGGSATATFFVAGQGRGYYLVNVDVYNADTLEWLGSNWVDPQGTAG